MSATEVAGQTGGDDTAIRPFQVGFPEPELTELGRRISAIRWPEREMWTPARICAPSVAAASRSAADPAPAARHRRKHACILLVLHA